MSKKVTLGMVVGAAVIGATVACVVHHVKKEKKRKAWDDFMTALDEEDFEDLDETEFVNVEVPDSEAETSETNINKDETEQQDAESSSSMSEDQNAVDNKEELPEKNSAGNKKNK